MGEKVIEIKLDGKKNISGLFKYEQDSRRYHRFQVKTDEGEGIVGTIYVPKERDVLPDRILLERVRQ